MKKLKLNSLKKLFTVTLTTLFLVGFNLSPAQAATTVSCSGGGSFTYTGTTVDGNSGLLCVGTAVIPNTITIIDTYAFAGARGLTAVTIGTSVTRINDYAFNDTRLSTVTIPNNVQTLGNGVFETSPLLTTVTIGTGLTVMGAYTFGNTSGALTSVTFEGNAPTVGAEPFYERAANAKAIIKFTATGFGANGSDWNGLTVSMNRGAISCGTSGTFTVASYNVTGNTSCVGTVNIPSGVLTISTNAFLNNTAITSVTIPNSVTSIGATSFQNAQGLTTLTIGNSVTTIENNAFEGTFRLPALIIPDSVVTIGSSAFSGTNALTSLTLGNQLETIGNSAFSGSDITSLIIPDSVETIGFDAFSGSRLNSLTLGNRLTTIGDFAFENSALTSVTLPASLTTLGEMVFGSPLVDVNFLGNAPANVDPSAFFDIGTGAKANVPYNATGFGANGSTWNRLIVSYESAPAEDSGSSTASVTTPAIVKTADAVFNLKNKKYLTKYAMKTKLSKNKSFKRVPEDLYKYSIFKASKKTCAINGNNVTGLKKTGTCELYVTRTTTKGAKYKYWVQINYTK